MQWLESYFFVAVSQTTCAGAGNKCPMKRLAFPDIDQDLFNDSLDSYVRAFGMKESFNLYNYKAMAPQHAEHARSMFKLHKLLKALLAASPSAQIKYRHLKAGVVHIQQTFGEEVLSAHHTTKDSNLLAGSIADCLTVLLNHWRRVAGTDSNFEKFLTKLDDSQAEIMRALRDGAEPASSSKGGRQLAPHVSAITEDSEGFPELSSACPKNTKKRQLEPKISQVTVDSLGFPTMSVTTPSKKKKGSLASEAAAASPPPATKEEWKGQVMKKPAAKIARAAEDADPAEVVIHVPSLSIGGGKGPSIHSAPARRAGNEQKARGFYPPHHGGENDKGAPVAHRAALAIVQGQKTANPFSRRLLLMPETSSWLNT